MATSCAERASGVCCRFRGRREIEVVVLKMDRPTVEWVGKVPFGITKSLLQLSREFGRLARILEAGLCSRCPVTDTPSTSVYTHAVSAAVRREAEKVRLPRGRRQELPRAMQAKVMNHIQTWSE